MARDDHSSDQERLFPTDEYGQSPESPDEEFEEQDAPLNGQSPAADFASEDERLRNGDITFRPVSLPAAASGTAARKGGTGGTALMILAAIAVVVLLTWVIYTFYSPVPSGPGASVSPAVKEVLTGELDTEAAVPAYPDELLDEAAGSSAIFQAHADLQEKYRLSESRIDELETELKTLRAGASSAAPMRQPAGSEPDRLARLEDENRELKAELEKLRRDSEAAVSRAEKLVERAETQVAEERVRTRDARHEAEQAGRRNTTLTEERNALSGERDVLVDERDSLRERVAQLESDLSQNRAEYERLNANTTTRLEGESEAVRQLISRHAQDLEKERKVAREKEEEIQRLKTLIARLSVSDTGTGTSRTTADTRSGSAGGGSTADNAGEVTAPRILTRREPVYPVNARRLRVEGTVVLNVLVGIDGKVREVKVLQADGGRLLSPAAVEAVREWTFAPATRDGRAVECWHRVPIQFALQGS